MKTAPIFLLLNGQTDGPHEYEDVNAMLEEGEIKDDAISSIEGMPSWRSVRETMVWSQAKLLNLILPEFTEMVEQVSTFKIESRDARQEIRNLLMRKNILTADCDALETVLRVNGLLKKNHREFINREQDWDEDGMNAFPSMEFLKFGEPKFLRDWQTDWQRAGGRLFGERMVARKDDPVWLTLSDFGYPFEPLSFDHGMGVMTVDVDESEKLGLTTMHDVVKPNHNIGPFRLVGL